MNDLAIKDSLLGLNHAAYRCRDANETADFYEGVLGFELAAALEIEGHPTTGEPICFLHVFFDIGSQAPAQSSYIAFFEVPDNANAGHDFEFKRQWGLDLHFAMTVADHAALLRWRDRLLGRGVEVEGPIAHDVFTSIYFHDPNGYRLEFTAQNNEEAQAFNASKAEAHTVLRRWSERKSKA